MKLIVNSHHFSANIQLAENSSYCRQEFEDAIQIEAITAGDVAEAYNLVDFQVCIAHCAPYPEGAVFSYLQIKFCPFCGKKFEVEQKNY